MKRKVCTLLCSVLLLLSLFVTPLTAQAEGTVVVDRVVTSDAAGNKTETGTIDGAKYLIKVPSHWNESLVMYAHGYVFPYETVNLPAISDLRDALVGEGFAFAYSSYANTGYSVESGVKSTYKLEQYFHERYGDTRERYMMGHSLGGEITMGVIETYKEEFNGALPMCGVVGSSITESKYLSDFRIVFDYFTNHALPGTAANIPASLQVGFGSIVPPLVLNLFATNPAKVALIAKATGVPADPASFINVLFFNIFATNDAAARAGGNPYGNRNVVYKASDTDAALNTALNAGVERFDATPAAVKYFKKWYVSTGEINIPVLALHNTVDPVVPFNQEAQLAKKINEQGNSEQFSLQTVKAQVHNPQAGPGHCDFTLSEEVYAFHQLLKWVQDGAYPPNGDITNR